MNELKVVGKQEFMGKEIPIIEGGFGENQRIITVDEVCNIHESRKDKVNELINTNIDEFEFGVDILDLMSDENSLNLAKGLGLITNNRQKNCYILSEQGYMLLTSFMRTEKAKEIRKQFRREYFTMRQVIQSSEQLKAMYLLKAVESNGEESVIAIKAYSDIRIKEETAPLIEDIKNKEVIIEEQKVEIKETKNELVNTSELLSGAIENMDIYKKKDIINRVIKRAGSGFAIQNRYNEIYKAYRETKHIDLPLRTKGYNMKQQKKKDHLSTIKYAEKFGHISDLYEVVCNLYSSDVKELLEELNETFKG